MPEITVSRLDSGYWLIRRNGEQWSQPPHWPCSEAVFRAHAFNPGWLSPAFVRDAMRLAESGERAPDGA